MAKNPLIRSYPRKVSKPLPNKSAGILDDFAVRRNVATNAGTVEKVPINDNDIVNKKYLDSANGFVKKTGDTMTGTLIGTKLILNQTADGEGLEIFGFDDKSNESIKINIASDGVAKIITSSKLTWGGVGIDFLAIGGDITFSTIGGEINFTDENLTTTGTITGINVTSGADPGHTHTGASISGIDISDDTNLAVGDGVTLTGDTLDLADKTCRVLKGTDKTITNNTNTVIDFNGEDIDTDGMHDNSTNNSRITFKTAGRYLITVRPQWDFNSTGTRLERVQKNGVAGAYVLQNRHKGENHTGLTFSGWWDFEVDDYIELFVFQNSGGDLLWRRDFPTQGGSMAVTRLTGVT